MVDFSGVPVGIMALIFTVVVIIGVGVLCFVIENVELISHLLRLPFYLVAVRNGLQPTAPLWVLRMFFDRCFSAQTPSTSPFQVPHAAYRAEVSSLSHELTTARARLLACGCQADWTAIFKSITTKALVLKERASVLERVAKTMTTAEIKQSCAAIGYDFDVWVHETRKLFKATGPKVNPLALQFILGEKVSPIELPAGAQERIDDLLQGAKDALAALPSDVMTERTYTLGAIARYVQKTTLLYEHIRRFDPVVAEEALGTQLAIIERGVRAQTAALAAAAFAESAANQAFLQARFPAQSTTSL